MLALPLSTCVQKINLFEPIALWQMDSVKLMARTDQKFLMPFRLLSSLLEDLRPHYSMLEINGQRLCDYKTQYFDFLDLRLYHQHHSGQLVRHKVRQRTYVHSHQVFMEVKTKNNKERTIKNRIHTTAFQDTFDKDSLLFLNQHIPYDPTELKPVLWVDYTRLTLVNHAHTERLTIDLNLTFRSGWRYKNYGQLVVAEVKQDGRCDSVFLELMKRYQIREGGLSKYCLGVVSLCPTIKHNRFKPKLLHLQKVIQ
ncbi:MAG: polyphosphate polymerase domain-containing protein [Runella sp.]